jgi:uncharacterized membrane protein required for colicin V production
MTIKQKILTVCLALWGGLSVYKGSRRLFELFARNPLTDNLIALGICFALMAVLWLVYRKFFADIVDPIVKDCIGSIQKHLGIRKSA